MNSLTSTPHSCISRMDTVALVLVVTVQKRGLTPITMNIVQPDGSNSLTKVCSRECQCSCSSWRSIKSRNGFSFILPLPSAEYPSCLQTTWASSDPQKSSHTVPHDPPEQISTLPSVSFLPLTSWRLPSLVQLSGLIKTWIIIITEHTGGNSHRDKLHRHLDCAHRCLQFGDYNLTSFVHCHYNEQSQDE